MGGEFRHNHYVPEWYQRRFMLPGQSRYYRLDLQPETVIGSNGHKWKRKELHKWAPDRVFAEDDLYTTRWGEVTNTEIERFFFGKLDNDGPKAVDYFTNFQHPSVSGPIFENFLTYLSVQKLRTPKGLSFLLDTMRLDDKNATLLELQKIQRMYCAVWTECIWQIADASKSPTKFIVSDHPVTVQPGVSALVGLLPGAQRSRHSFGCQPHAVPALARQALDPYEPKLGA